MPNYTFNITHPVIKGQYDTSAPNERAAIKNIVFRELQERNRTTGNITSKALLVSSEIFEKHMYFVVSPKNQPSIPSPVFDPVESESDYVPPSRRGDQEYPENPDEEDDNG